HMQILSWGPCMCLVANIVFAFFLLFPGILSHVQLVQSVPGAVNPGHGSAWTLRWVRQALGKHLQWVFRAQYTRNYNPGNPLYIQRSSRRAEHTARYHCVRD
uniref:Uncharacterized protein n=1 Tax=Gopherus evgoodei TaxID=1825980 RepID=A0A8C4YS82_9SAUR